VKKKKKSKVPERLQWQLSYHVDVDKLQIRGDMPVQVAVNAAVEAARAHFMATGHSIPGVKIVGRWRNPDNRNPRHADWKTTEDSGQSLSGFWQTLGRGRGALS
jgi:hypothetical protein